MDSAEGIQVQNGTPSDVSQAVQDAPQEKTLKQSEVNELLFRLKAEAYEKGKRDAAQQAPAQGAGHTLGGMPQLTEEQVRHMIADEAHKKAQEHAVHGVLTNFASQMDSAKGKYSDFDETVAGLGDLRNYAHVIKMATDAGNAGDIMYELGKNPSKIANLTTLAYINPALAEKEMTKLVASIKANDEAKNTPDVEEPYTQVKPSTVSTDNGSSSIRDLRKKSWAKG